MKLAFLALALLTPSLRGTSDWPHWRGPHFNGSTEARNLPVDFDKTHRVKWASALPGPAASTPIVLGDQVFLSSVDEERSQLLALCIDRTSGTIQWQRSVGSGYRPEGADSDIRLHTRSNYASPSAVSDGDHVVFFFGNGDMVTLDLDGNELWSRNLQKEYGDFSFQWTFSASPTLFQGRLYLPILQRDTPVNGRGREGNESFLLALDPETGDEIFKHPRPSNAVKESLESYATPIPFVGKEGRAELLVVGGDVVSGHDPKTGTELWRWGTWNEGHREQWWRLVPSPVVGEGLVLVCAPKRAPVFAVKLGGNGNLGEPGLAWHSEGRANPVSSDVPTPLFYRGKFFVLSDVRETLSCVEPATGNVLWTKEMPGRHLWRASPTGADEKIWCINHHGDVAVFDLEGQILHEASMGDEDDDLIRSSIVVAADHLFIRTNHMLFCIGDDEKTE